VRFLPDGDEVACECPDCTCSNTTDIVTDNGTPVCACCIADCADVHGPDGVRPE
jgi:hypothetical protein